jgi:hypothetical protein
MYSSVVHARQEILFINRPGAQKVPCSLSMAPCSNSRRDTRWKSYPWPLDDIDKLCLWMDGVSDITTRCVDPLPASIVLVFWSTGSKSPHPSAVIIFLHRNSGRHHYHGTTTVCGLMASYFHNPYHVVAIEGDCSYLISLPIYSSM